MVQRSLGHRSTDSGPLDLLVVHTHCIIRLYRWGPISMSGEFLPADIEILLFLSIQKIFPHLLPAML